MPARVSTSPISNVSPRDPKRKTKRSSCTAVTCLRISTTTGWLRSASGCERATWRFSRSRSSVTARGAILVPRSLAPGDCSLRILGAKIRCVRSLRFATSRAIRPVPWPSTTRSRSGCAPNSRSHRCRRPSPCAIRFFETTRSVGRAIARRQHRNKPLRPRRCCPSSAANANSRDCTQCGAAPRAVPARWSCFAVKRVSENRA